MTRLSIRTDRSLIRAHGRSKRFVLAEVTAPHATQTRKRPPVNLAFVLDRSGSMAGQKLEFAKRAIHDALGRLDDQDRFSIVFYDDRIDVIVESTPATDEARRNALRRLDAVDARGSTNLGEGWLRGCEQVASHLSDGGVDRVLLLTDGLANQGITDPDELAHHAAELRARGVSTTTFGVGNDFDEALLQAMADAGGGHFYYIAEAAQIRDHISSEVGEALEVVASDVELELLTAEGVEVEAISPHRVIGRTTRRTVSLGELVSDQAVEIVFQLTFPYGDSGRETGLIVGIHDRSGAFAAARVGDARLTWTWADHAANDAQHRDVEVDRVVARQFAARARLEAVRDNKAGDFDDAQRALRGVARRIRGYAGRDRELRDLVHELEGEADRFARPMAPAMLKEAHFSSVNALRSRMPSGEAMRRR